jgi:hypothetical protein
MALQARAWSGFSGHCSTGMLGVEGVAGKNDLLVISKLRRVS